MEIEYKQGAITETCQTIIGMIDTDITSITTFMTQTQDSTTKTTTGIDISNGASQKVKRLHHLMIQMVISKLHIMIIQKEEKTITTGTECREDLGVNNQRKVQMRLKSL